jgi:hypothetical protein
MISLWVGKYRSFLVKAKQIRRKKMKKLLLGSIAIAAMFIIGCGGAAVLEAPEITKVVMEETSVTVTWVEDTTVTALEDFSGYNVYVYTDSTALLVEDGEDLNKDNADVITGNSYEATGLSQDTIYYIQVRTVNTDDKVGSYNATVPFVEASPRPEFTVQMQLELSNADSNEVNCGLRFETATVSDESLNVFPGADVFFERFSDTLQVNSASRRTATGFTPRTTLMHNYGQIEFDDLSEVNTNDIDVDHEIFIVGDLIVFKTEEDNYVKLHVDAYDSTLATVDVTYAYQNIANYPHFSP